MSVFTVDFGHSLSGADVGARGNGLVEEVLTREIGNLVVNGLRKEGHTVHPIILDHATSLSSSLNYRVDKVISINPDQSVSIHINSAVNPLATGVEVWGDNLCKDKCTRICNNIAKEFNLPNRGFKNGVETLAMVGLYGQSNVPALLVECFFICNADDCNKYNAQKYADSIVAGILNKEVSSGGATANPTPPKPQPPTPPTVNKEILRIKNASAWSIYPLGVATVKANAIGSLNPRDYGTNGVLEYEILDKPKANVCTIQTRDYGRVNIYLPVGDNEWEIVGKPSPQPPAPSPSGTDEVRRYDEKGTFYPNTKIYFRNSPSTVSSNAIQGSYDNGESVKYDTVVIGTQYNWISWTNSSNVRRYMPTKDKVAGTPMWGRVV